MENQKLTVIVSGGSKGLGKGIIQYLLDHDYQVATFSRQETSFIREIFKSKHKDNFYWESLDASNHLNLNKFVKNIVSRFGKIDALINNVGMAVDALLTLTPSDAISKTLNVNLESVIRLTQACVKHMLPKKEGVIINISSIIGIRGYSGLSIYSATKAGLDAFTRSLSRELGARGIRVNSVAPGYLETDMSSSLSNAQLQQIKRRTPLGRLGKVDDIVGAIQFLLSPASKFITGQTLVIDGGITC